MEELEHYNGNLQTLLFLQKTSLYFEDNGMPDLVDSMHFFYQTFIKAKHY